VDRNEKAVWLRRLSRDVHKFDSRVSSLPPVTTLAHTGWSIV
jgi:hypothetical protein